ncbi:up-regulator of cell proliferation-like [Astyanax mexicanus]|uniref:Up-regulator of cell proliferation-like n=1 Tax=Astyanax mexicanus TaxID=7994 RepID=A0A8T2KYU3_ASTMX|nr:up-regulator of cell proliferation-like [Astyanax mexicanus]
MSMYRQKNTEKGTRTTEIVRETDRDKHVLLQMLDLHRQKVDPVDLMQMLYLTSSCVEDNVPQNPTELSTVFLRRLWLYHPQARDTSCEVVAGAYTVARPPEVDESSQCAINPLDLVAAVFMTTNSFLQQEIANRMVLSHFAVPLYLPPVYPEKRGTFLLSPFRGVLGRWKSHSLDESRNIMKNMASSRMPFLSAVRLGHCSVSKSRVLNRVLGGSHELHECFTNRNTDGGQLPRILSDGLIEVSWNLSMADQDNKVNPLLMANLRGDAAECNKQVSLLCYASAVLLVFCGNLGMKERKLLSSWRDNASHLILIDCSEAMQGDAGSEECEHEKMKNILIKDLELSEECVINAHDGNEENLAWRLSYAMNKLVSHLHPTNLVAAAGVASDLNMKVDEDELSQMAFTEVEEVLNGIESGVSKFLEEQLPLQGPRWKQLCDVEQKQGKLKEDVHLSLSQESSGGNKGLVEEFMSYKLTEAMKTFLEALFTYDTTKRAFFLSWMRVKLQVMQLDKLSDTEEDQQQGPCIGLEHFLREMGLIYERYFRGPTNELYNMFSLPYLAAELLLYGVPLELFDGDASVFPLNWVYSVLYEVYKQVPQNSRMRVLTTFGFHDSKNAELLSSLFGVSFPKWGQRHIKGAYMLLLSLPDNIRMQLDCEFLILIVTEGLNFLHAGQTEESLLHANQLATFVSGLSDVTLVNLPQEGLAGTQNNLQIAVNAVLHTRDLPRKPDFQVVSEGPAKDAKILSCVIDILNQKKSLGTEGGNINHSLVGPWTDQNLFSETDQIYSDAVLELKQSLLAVLHNKATTCQPTCMGAFMEHMCNFWETVKNLTFATGLEDTHAAGPLIGLCTKVVEGEEQLGHRIKCWVEGLDNRISELEESASQSGDYVDDPDGVHRILDEEAAMLINSESDKLKSSLWDYFRQEDIDMAFVEPYQSNLLERVSSTEQQAVHGLNPKIETAIIRHDMSVKMQALLTALEAALEVRLRSLLESCKNNNNFIDDKQLEEEFIQVWNDIPSNLELLPLETHEIRAKVIEKLRENLQSRGLKKQKVKLRNHQNGFTVKNGHLALRSKMKRTLKHNKEVAQRFTDNLIEDCDRRVSEKLKHKEDYSDSYMREILAIVDKGLEVLKMESFVMKPKFEADLKGYICSKATESFQNMQNLLKRERETKENFLYETQERHLLDFIHNFRRRDQCQKAAWEFTNQCLRPAALDFIYTSLERQIFDDILQGANGHVYSLPKTFHYHLLKELLLEDNFEKFLEYLQSNESYCRKRIEGIIVEHLSGSVMIEDRREQRMQQICQRMENSINLISEDGGTGQSNARQLLESVCAVLQSPGDVTVSADSLRMPLFEVIPQRENFITQLKECVAELSLSLVQEFGENEDVIEVPEDLSYKLQDLLYDHIKGCDEQCPFCKAPCDLGGTEHAVHQAIVHRPKGLVCYTNAGSTSLSHLTCSAEMVGENQFQNRHTGGLSLPYKDYQSIYPNWNIPPEWPKNNETGTFWKYVFMRYNARFAQNYQCESATVPEEWKKIRQEDALRNLKKAFSINEWHQL